MSVQMTVRISDDLAAWVDQRVEQGAVSSRAAAIAQALRRDLRRALYADEAARLADSLSESGARESWEPGAQDGARRANETWARHNAADVLADLD